jgi:hypothetical protein
MADDKGDAATVGGVGKVELDPSSGLEDELAPSRLAFCSSTLEKKLGLVIKKDKNCNTRDIMVTLGFILNYVSTNIVYNIKIKLYLISIKYLATAIESLFPVIVICRSSFSPFS